MPPEPDVLVLGKPDPIGVSTVGEKYDSKTLSAGAATAFCRSRVRSDNDGNGMLPAANLGGIAREKPDGGAPSAPAKRERKLDPEAFLLDGDDITEKPGETICSSSSSSSCLCGFSRSPWFCM